MKTKTISITKEVYDMLLVEKEENESFSDVISRLVKRRSKLSDSFGKWEMTDKEIQKFKSELRNMWQEWQL
ncbi:MAG: antitoxin [Theionarchaea archaeon]|nr:antitoxin [Theionarchaea archaeon]